MGEAGDATGGPLDRLCRRLGVAREYEAAGARHRSPDHAVLAALGALAAPLGLSSSEPVDPATTDPAALDAEGLLREVERQERSRLLEPVTVAWNGGSSRVGLTDDAADGPVEVRLRREDGSEASWSLSARDAAQEGIALPTDLPEGYHDLTVRVDGREATTRIVRAPRTAWDGPLEEGAEGAEGGEGAEGPERSARDPRGWAAFLPLHALRTERSWGTGDLTDLAALARWVGERGGEAVATLPLLAGFLGGGEGGEGPFDPSPYAPVSRLFWNELYVDPERAARRAADVGLLGESEALGALEGPGLQGEIRALRELERVDHRRAMAAKRRALAPLAAAAAGRLDDLPAPLARYLDRRPDALSYARFRAVTEARGAPWRSWPERLRDAPLRASDLPADAAPAVAVAHHLVAQWTMDEQLGALGPDALYLDLPLGSHADGYDLWRHRDVFAAGFSGGAPPDAFFTGGQDWGFPPLHPVASRESGHAYWIRSLRHLMSACGILRLDHVMSLFRLFWVPSGGSATDGVYVRYPAEELWAILCLESRRHQVEVVGEDLGTVPPEVPAAMEEHRTRRTWVVPFHIGPGGYDAPSRRSVASVGTHDMPPFAAFWRGRDLETRLESGHLDPDAVPRERAERARWCRAVQDVLEERGLVAPDPALVPSPDPGAPPGLAEAEALEGLLRLLASSDARLVVVALEDLWLETEPQNVPGTPGEMNWAGRARLTLEEMAEDGRVERLLGAVREGRSGGVDE